MTLRRPIAFLSYVRSDDAHDGGRITEFRKRLEGEVRMQTGEDFSIFQDRNDISWGQNWEERIETSLSDVTFLIPIITPSFFRSHACRQEFLTFLHRETTLGINRLILPLYYVSCDQLSPDHVVGSDEIADIVSQRNWTDWRQLRFKSLSEETAAAALAELASTIKSSISELNTIWAISRSKETKSYVATLDGRLSEDPLEEEPAPTEAPDDNRIASVELLEVPELNPEVSDKPIDMEAARSRGYYVYTKRFDEIIDAANLAEKGELLTFYGYLTSFVQRLNQRIGTLLTSFLSPFSLKAENPPIAVSLLIDNSGSMRGHKIVETAASCVLIAEWMDRLRIPTEILGFTTRAWKGGRSRELWLASGKPSRPGRLNDLRHIVYKPFSASILSAAPNLAAMLRDGVLKENIDGEALLWAASRLQQRPEPHKILFVISDGAAVDDSTLSQSPGNFLEGHLLQVIDWLPSNIRLYALGLECDISRYYPNAVTVTEAAGITSRIFEILVNDSGFAEGFASSQPQRRYRFPPLPPAPTTPTVRHRRRKT